MPTEIETLKPCPFCGRRDAAQGASREYISVWCFCGAQGPEVSFPEYGDPVPPINECRAAWNRRAALDSPIGEQGVGVKALEWTATGQTGFLECQYYAVAGSLRHTVHPVVTENGSFFEHYDIRKADDEWLLRYWVGNNGLSGIAGKFATLDEAKAAAQADFTRRILSALSPERKEPVGRETELRRAAQQSASARRGRLRGRRLSAGLGRGLGRPRCRARRHPRSAHMSGASELVERLRERAGECALAGYERTMWLLNDAADELSRLSSAHSEAVEDARKHLAELAASKAENERLRCVANTSPNTLMIAYEDGDHQHLARAAARAIDRAETAEAELSASRAEVVALRDALERATQLLGNSLKDYEPMSADWHRHEVEEFLSKSGEKP